MILIDSSVWIDHFRSIDPVLTQMLDQRQALVHPFIIGKLALDDSASERPLLAGTLLTVGTTLWALDKRLPAVAARIGLDAEPVY